MMTPQVFVANAHLLAASTSGRVLAGGDGDLGAASSAFVVVVVLSVACYFLFKSMSRHLGKVPASFDATAAPPTASPPTDPSDP